MSPVPRCSLRLPNEPRKSAGSVDAQSIAEDGHSGKTKRSADESEGYAHAERTRDSAEVLEDSSEFRTSVTRDSAEVLEHNVAEGTDIDTDAGQQQQQQQQEGSASACELLERCRAEVEQAIANGECELMKCPSLDAIGTPGNVCAQFCQDRQDSPGSVYQSQSQSSQSKKKKGKKGAKSKNKKAKKKESCKGTYLSGEVYTSLWGSGKAVDYRKRLETQMKKKRKLLEKMHLKDFLRRQKMRRRAKEKRAALKQKDQTKIPSGDDNLRINKAYGLRLNYNKQLPLMPADMRRHMDKFKKPPFKQYVTGKKPYCAKRIDEFDKLRVPDDNKISQK